MKMETCDVGKPVTYLARQSFTHCFVFLVFLSWAQGTILSIGGGEMLSCCLVSMKEIKHPVTIYWFWNVPVHTAVI